MLYLLLIGIVLVVGFMIVSSMGSMSLVSKAKNFLSFGKAEPNSAEMSALTAQTVMRKTLNNEAKASRVLTGKKRQAKKQVKQENKTIKHSTKTPTLVARQVNAEVKATNKIARNLRRAEEGGIAKRVLSRLTGKKPKSLKSYRSKAKLRLFGR